MKARSWSDLGPGRQTAALVGLSVQISLAVTAWRDLAHRPARQVNGRKAMWAGIIALNYVGPIAYFIWGRRR